MAQRVQWSSGMTGQGRFVMKDFSVVVVVVVVITKSRVMSQRSSACVSVLDVTIGVLFFTL